MMMARIQILFLVLVRFGRRRGREVSTPPPGSPALSQHLGDGQCILE